LGKLPPSRQLGAEAEDKLDSFADKLRKATFACDELRDRLTSELEEYQALQRTSRDEKRTALATEKNLRKHYEHMNDVWKW
jgi:hypothetical protein